MAVVGDIDPSSFKSRLSQTQSSRKIEKAALSTYPSQNVYIWKVWISKVPKVDFGKLMEVHDDHLEDVDAKLEMTY
ncbi:hypothetical protein PVL29_023015 [Vitis rotundifolia]|uniref:Uncharacterized protein n=1 Tax=Vitis rotundifolia TaxID=103349 RepID=A0AA39DBS8_VITRO|nr:hypothetical protein PVL29_023015 [Vitis rotundifolia]